MTLRPKFTAELSMLKHAKVDLISFRNKYLMSTKI